jgi:D-alanine--poly(phosphoribitol) ligase subunit 2
MPKATLTDQNQGMFEFPSSGPGDLIIPTISDMSECLRRVKHIFSEKLLLKVDSPESDLLDSGLLDSMGLIQLLLNIEQEFGVRVAMDELDVEDFRSMAKIAEFVDDGRKLVRHGEVAQ